VAQTVSRRTVAEEARFKSQAISCGNCREESDTGMGCAPNTAVFTCEMPFHQSPTPIRLRITDFIQS
jgi:hypothetical protein